MPEQTKQPTYMRYAHVETILNSEPAFKSRMGDKTEAVMKPNGQTGHFAKQVVEVTDLIHQTGGDACSTLKADIIRTAMQVFGIGGAPPPVQHVGNSKPATNRAPRRAKIKVSPKRHVKKEKKISPKIVAAEAPKAVEPKADNKSSVPSQEKYECARCNYKWQPRTPGVKPQVCPKCKNPNWATPKPPKTAKRARLKRQAKQPVAKLEEVAATAVADAAAPVSVPPTLVPPRDVPEVILVAPESDRIQPPPPKKPTPTESICAVELTPDMPPHLVYSPMFSLSAALEQFLENLDRQPGHERRLEAQKRMTNEMSSLARIPKQIAAFVKKSSSDA